MDQQTLEHVCSLNYIRVVSAAHRAGSSCNVSPRALGEISRSSRTSGMTGRIDPQKAGNSAEWVASFPLVAAGRNQPRPDLEHLSDRADLRQRPKLQLDLDRSENADVRELYERMIMRPVGFYAEPRRIANPPGISSLTLSYAAVA